MCSFGVLSLAPLQNLPKGIAALRSLRVLDLEGNKLEYLATEISYLRELQKLNVQSNRITHLPRGLGFVNACTRASLSLSADM